MAIGSAGSAACVHSALAPRDVSALVERAWGMRATRPSVLISYGINDHYLQPTATGDVVVRVYQHGWRDDEEVLWELELLRHLADRGAPVAAALPTTDGAIAVAVDAPEGRRQVAVFPRASGRDTYSQWSARGDGSHIAMAQTYGGAIGAIHDAASGFTTGRRRFSLDIAHLVDEPLEALTDAPNVPADVLDVVQRTADALRPELLRHTASGRLEWGACHGDLNGGNAAGDAGGVIVFDFDCGGWSWVAYDLAVVRWSIAMSADYYDVSGQWDAVLDGYTSNRQLRDEDLAATAPFTVARQLWFFGIHSRNSRRVGFGWQGDAYFEPGTRFLRRWLDEGAVRSSG